MSKSRLAEYEAKRDFAKTGEPSGRSKIPSSRKLRFVMQKHDATRLHYDLRLELDGVFKSWAVTKGPSLDPHDKRLAVEVEDHPLDYGDFEGTIPKGQYGGGTVQLWDRGYWEYEGVGSAEAALRKGELKFKLDGERLKGGWVLVRMRSDKLKSKRNSWLLIKHRDAFERLGNGDGLLEEDRSVASGRPMAVIAAGKGRSPKSFMRGRGEKFQPDAVWDSNKGDAAALRAQGRMTRRKPPASAAREPELRKSSGTLPTFVAPQLCTLVQRPPSGRGWGHEIKFDGYRLQMRVENGNVCLRTRKGLDRTEKFSTIASAAKKFEECILDGEIVALDHDGTPDFAALQAALSDGKPEQLVFFVFDLLYAGSEDLRGLPLADRKARLEAILAGHKQPNALIRFVEHFETGGEAVLRSACRMSLEGTVSKRLAPYVSAWCKDFNSRICADGRAE